MGAGQPGNARVGIVIQARMKSTRFPGKVLIKIPLKGKHSVLGRILLASKNISSVQKICVATSRNLENDPIQSEAQKYGVSVFRGDEENVFQRFLDAAQEFNLDHIIRLTADNPIVDRHSLEKLISFHIYNNFDHSRTKGLPIGMNMSIFSLKSLKKASRMRLSSYDKEHVEPKLLNEACFKKGILSFDGFANIEELRLTIDYYEDYLYVSSLLSFFGDDEFISAKKIQDLVKEQSDLVSLNQSHYQKENHHSFEEELNAAIRVLEKLELLRVVTFLKELEGSDFKA